MSSEPRAYELPLRLLLGFRVLIDGLHERLRREGHPDLRPLDGFVLQAVAGGGVTATELGRRLGISKQGAAKHVEALERSGYVERRADPADARSKRLDLTDRGRDALVRSAAIFEDLRADWARALGEERLRALEEDLRRLTPSGVFPLDTPGWFGGH
ncbi:MAG TPA: MarR family winged helix-turn-helix transcriptional regulator [Pilimelia sp.]|nr:MarR family winged helix-turn-helix transcriptional regulator [Pilimelia sp.]